MSRNQLQSVFSAFGDRLRATAARILGDSQAAQDAVQDAFCRLWSKDYGQISCEEAERISYTAVHRQSIDMLRRRNAHPAMGLLDSDAEAAVEPGAGEDEFDETYRRVTLLIDKHLSERDAEILRLREQSEMEFADIAARYGITEANVRMSVSRSRRKIKEIYILHYGNR